MKQKLLFLILLLGMQFTFAAEAFKVINKQRALQIAEIPFYGRDVDYYIDPTSEFSTNFRGGEWIIFVDAAPGKGWMHECYLLHIPHTTNFFLKMFCLKLIL